MLQLTLAHVILIVTKKKNYSIANNSKCRPSIKMYKVVKELVDNYKQLMEQNTIGYIQNLDQSS